jgi:hypothetical protein
MDPTKIYTPSFKLPSGGQRRLHTAKNIDKAHALKTISGTIKFELEKRRAEASLYEFVKQAWHVVEPGVEFSEGWHIHTICDHLEAVIDRRIKNLIINIPPRHSKSTICSVIWPVWAWLKRPEEKFLTASYSGSLSVRDAVKSRRLIESAWFQERWPHISLNRDQNTKQRYENDSTGYRIAASVGGTTTGEGGSVLLCLHGDTMLECSQGHVSIREIVENQLNTAIAGYCHDTNVKQFNRIVRYDKNPPKRMLKLVTRTGRAVVVTEDHPVFVTGKGYVPASEVRQNDRVLCSMQQRAESKTESDKAFKDSSMQHHMSPRADTQSSCDNTVRCLWNGSSKDAGSPSSKRDGCMLLKRVFRKITNWIKQ